MEKSSELRKKIKNKDKGGLDRDFNCLFLSLDSKNNLGVFIEANKFLCELRDYILEECE